MKGHELMDSVVGSVREGTPLSAPTRLSWKDEIGCLPVVSALRQVVGMPTVRDAAPCAWLERRPLEELAEARRTALALELTSTPSALAEPRERSRELREERGEPRRVRVSRGAQDRTEIEDPCRGSARPA